MSAITTHLEEEDPTTAAEEAQDSRGNNANQVIYEAHAGLLNMAYVRQVVHQALAGRKVSVQWGKLTGKGNLSKGSDAFLVLDQPLDNVPAWNPIPGAGRYFALLSWTSKMMTPSWSLPAGAPHIGGACPGAIGGQSTTPDGARHKHRLQVLQTLKRNVSELTFMADSVCARCYATGGQYSTGQVQLAQLLRFHWTIHALHSGTFVPTMVEAIGNANFRLKEAYVAVKDKQTKQKTGEMRLSRAAEKSGRYFFRVHDSGDFFALPNDPYAYLNAWYEIAASLPHITFWAPSRIWAAQGLPKSPPKNFIIRPSSYLVNQAGPKDLPHWTAECTTVYHVTKVAEGQGRTFDWNCQAYATEDDHTCREALAPDAHGNSTGKTGCRACWIHPHLRINYTEH